MQRLVICALGRDCNMQSRAWLHITNQQAAVLDRWVVQLSASGVLDTLVMGTTDAAAQHSIPTQLEGPLWTFRVKLESRTHILCCGMFKDNSVPSLSEQVCLGPKDFLNDW